MSRKVAQSLAAKGRDLDRSRLERNVATNVLIQTEIRTWISLSQIRNPVQVDLEALGFDW